MLTILASLLLGAVERPLYHPTTEQIAASYARADTIGPEWVAKTAMLRIEPTWMEGGKSFWYRKQNVDGTSVYLRVDSASGGKSSLFDAKRLAEALSKVTGNPVDPNKLPFRTVTYSSESMRFVVDGQTWSAKLADYSLEKVATENRRPDRNPPWIQDTWQPNRNPSNSPNGEWIARIVGTNIMIRPKDGQEVALASDGSDSAYYTRIIWARDSKHLIAVRVHPGDRKKVYLIQSSPLTWGPAVLKERIYDRPGDVVDTFQIVTLDPTKPNSPIESDRIEYGGIPEFRTTSDGDFVYDKMDRGYGRWRMMRLNPATGSTSAIFDDDPETFVDSTALIQEFVRGSEEMIASSERDGWHHLYLLDGKGGSKQITKGPWVVRSVANVDEKSRQITFTASGMDPSKDPYFVHYYRIGFDGTGLVALTPAKGNHTASFSPDREFLIDTYSTVVDPPIHELRNARTGGLVAQLEKADVGPLLNYGWKPPQPIVAKGRDGKTDIYGIVFRPSNFDRKKRYPVVEDIYAGPQDSFVPKSFVANFYQQRIADIGFIVVKIDGMGTRNRSKAFHDVCYKDLADAGFPDRIAWMKAFAKVEPSADLDRVGIFGTSAGGQNAGGAVLFHPDFYKVAVASCGCHDNRLDKIWWNEQWMGTMGPHYAASSNIENASKLQGSLLLIVGELDTNVPPESTYRFAAALQSAGKEYELVVIPNSDHTSGGTYGERKRRDFLVRNLLGVEPPNPNVPKAGK